MTTSESNKPIVYVSTKIQPVCLHSFQWKLPNLETFVSSQVNVLSQKFGPFFNDSTYLLFSLLNESKTWTNVNRFTLRIKPIISNKAQKQQVETAILNETSKWRMNLYGHIEVHGADIWNQNFFIELKNANKNVIQFELPAQLLVSNTCLRIQMQYLSKRFWRQIFVDKCPTNAEPSATTEFQNEEGEKAASVNDSLKSTHSWTVAMASGKKPEEIKLGRIDKCMITQVATKSRQQQTNVSRQREGDQPQTVELDRDAVVSQKEPLAVVGNSKQPSAKLKNEKSLFTTPETNQILSETTKTTVAEKSRSSNASVITRGTKTASQESECIFISTEESQKPKRLQIAPILTVSGNIDSIVKPVKPQGDDFLYLNITQELQTTIDEFTLDSRVKSKVIDLAAKMAQIPRLREINCIVSEKLRRAVIQEFIDKLAMLAEVGESSCVEKLVTARMSSEMSKAMSKNVKSTLKIMHGMKSDTENSETRRITKSWSVNDCCTPVNENAPKKMKKNYLHVECEKEAKPSKANSDLEKSPNKVVNSKSDIASPEDAPATLLAVQDDAPLTSDVTSGSASAEVMGLTADSAEDENKSYLSASTQLQTAPPISKSDLSTTLEFSCQNVKRLLDEFHFKHQRLCQQIKQNGKELTTIMGIHNRTDLHKKTKKLVELVEEVRKALNAVLAEHQKLAYNDLNNPDWLSYRDRVEKAKEAFFYPYNNFNNPTVNLITELSHHVNIGRGVKLLQTNLEHLHSFVHASPGNVAEKSKHLAQQLPFLTRQFETLKMHASSLFTSPELPLNSITNDFQELNGYVFTDPMNGITKLLQQIQHARTEIIQEAQYRQTQSADVDNQLKDLKQEHKRFKRCVHEVLTYTCIGDTDPLASFEYQLRQHSTQMELLLHDIARKGNTASLQQYANYCQVLRPIQESLAQKLAPWRIFLDYLRSVPKVQENCDALLNELQRIASSGSDRETIEMLETLDLTLKNTREQIFNARHSTNHLNSHARRHVLNMEDEQTRLESGCAQLLSQLRLQHNFYPSSGPWIGSRFIGNVNQAIADVSFDR